MAISRARRSGISIDTSPIRGRSLTRASGLPGPVTNIETTITGNTTATLSWSAPLISGDSEITGYEILGGGSASVSGTSATITGLSPNTSYTFSVRPITSVGRGRSNNFGSTKTTTNWNSATGGDHEGSFIVTSDILSADPNFNEVGSTWKWHWFTSSGTFSVQDGPVPFRILLIGGGQAGRNSASSGSGSGGTGGRVLINNSASFSSGDVTVSLGNGGSPSGGGGGASTLTQSGTTLSSANGGHSGGQLQHFLMGGSADYVSGSGGSGGGCAGSFGQRAGCGSLGQQNAGGGRGGCGCQPGDCYQCGGGCINCSSGHGALNGYGGGGGGGGACCGSGAGSGGRGGFIVCYRIG